MTGLKKYGVIGRGKTGSQVIEVLGDQVGAIFSSANPLDCAATSGLEAIIVFIPAEALFEILPTLVECGRPIVCGTTGFVYPPDLGRDLVRNQQTWIVGSNFSPGMNFLFAVAKLAEDNQELLGNPEFFIHETHHQQKRDSPSGTALTLQTLLGGGCKIKSERKGEHVGFHELSLSSQTERLNLQHEATSRKAFAEGAVFAARYFLPDLKPGLHYFENLMFERILKNSKLERV